MIEDAGVDNWIRNIRRRDSTFSAEEEALRGVLSEVAEVPAGTSCASTTGRPDIISCSKDGPVAT